MARHVRKGDTVEVLAGKYRGQRGRILDVLVDKGRVRVDGIAPIKRHLRPGVDPKLPNGGIIERFGTVHISNVLPICPKTDRPTRVGSRTVPGADGARATKVRVARRSNEQLPSQA